MNMLAALRCEVFLLRRSRGVWLTLGLPAVAAVATVAYRKGTILRGALPRAAGGQGVPIGELQANAYAPFVGGITVGIQLGVALLLVLAAIAIARGRERGTIRLPLIRGTTRNTLLLSRFLTLNVLAALMMATVVLAAGLTAATLFDFGDIQEEGYVYLSASEIQSEIAMALVAAALPLTAGIAAALLLSVAAPSASAAVTVTLITIYAFDLLKGMLGDFSSYAFITFLPTLQSGSRLAEVERLAAAFSDVGDLERLNLVTPIPQALLFLALALVLLHRRKL